MCDIIVVKFQQSKGKSFVPKHWKQFYHKCLEFLRHTSGQYRKDLTNVLEFLRSIRGVGILPHTDSKNPAGIGKIPQTCRKFRVRHAVWDFPHTVV